MKRSLRWVLLPTLFATAAAMSPAGFTPSSDSGIVGVTDALCFDCQKNTDFTCGTPPLDRENYCTAGAEHCKAQQT